MKATELMINDQIQIDEPDRYAGAIGQIKSLLHHKDEDSAYFHVFIQGTHGYVMREVCSDDIRPIPLTPEILEKNGFVKVENTLTSTIIYSFRDSLFRIGVFDFSHITMDSYYTDSSCDIFISSVHEFQHALRLCGIDKTIEL